MRRLLANDDELAVVLDPKIDSFLSVCETVRNRIPHIVAPNKKSRRARSFILISLFSIHQPTYQPCKKQMPAATEYMIGVSQTRSRVSVSVLK